VRVRAAAPGGRVREAAVRAAAVRAAAVRAAAVRAAAVRAAAVRAASGLPDRCACCRAARAACRPRLGVAARAVADAGAG
jgi:hypothetical protein